MPTILDSLLDTLPAIRDRQRKLYASLDQRRVDCGTLIKIVDLLILENSRVKHENRLLRERALTQTKETNDAIQR